MKDQQPQPEPPAVIGLAASSRLNREAINIRVRDFSFPLERCCNLPGGENPNDYSENCGYVWRNVLCSDRLSPE